MNYYIAKDRFGNYDLAHYGVQGMKWGERKLEDYAKIGRLSGAKPNSTNRSPGSGSASDSGLKKIWASGRNGKSGGASGSGSNPSVDPNKVKELVEASSDAPKNEDEARIEEATATYQAALMQMQLLARISLANGISPSANPEYVEALRKTIKAKYELDQLKLKQQEEAAKNPPTMAEQKQQDDSDAKKKLASDKAKERRKKAEPLEKTTDASKTGERAADVDRGSNRDKPVKKK